MSKQHGRTRQVLISPSELAERWRLSRTGAVRIAEKAGIPSVHLGNGPRSTRRFRLADVDRYEAEVTK